MSKVLRLVAVFICLLLLPAFAQAQPWTTVYSASYNIWAVKFLDAEGMGAVGFIGGDAAISRTANTGATWTASTLPAGFAGVVNCFTFKNAMIGFASAVNAGSKGGVLKTVDGGLTWAAVNAPSGEVNGIYYNTSNNRLFYVSGVDSAMVSTDDGASWTAFSDYPYTGIAFSTPQFGIISAAGIPVGSKHTYLYTVDGGLTWKSSPTQQDTWQPVGVPGTPYFFFTDFLNQRMYQTTNVGRSWLVDQSFNSGNIVSGTMTGDACGLFAATDNGVFSSIDVGQSWQPMGGPSTMIGHRFYASPTKVYAPAGKVLQSHARPPSPPIHLIPNSLTIAHAGCFNADTVITLAGCDCGNYQLVGVRFDSNFNNAFTLTPGALPRPFCGLDSVHVGYRPTSADPDSAFIRFSFLNNGVPVDTLIPVFGPGQPISVSLSTKSLIIRNLAGCQSFDTVIAITNDLCTTISLDDVSIDDPTHFQIIAPPTPSTLSPQQTVYVQVHASAIRYGQYYATITVKASSGGSSVTKTVPLTLLINKTPAPQIQGFNWQIKDLCSFHDTVVYYVNNLCDTITIYSGALPNDPNFKLGNIKYPVKLAPGDILRIPVTLLNTTPGTQFKTKLTFQGIIQDVNLDTSITLTYSLVKAAVIAAQVTPNGAAFGPTSLCDSTREITLVFENKQCFPLTVAQPVFNAFADSSYTFPHHFAPRTLQPGEQDSIRVHFWPSRWKTGEAGTISMTYGYQDKSNTVLVPFSGSGSTKVTASLGNTTLDFGTMKFCDQKELQTVLQNGPCGGIQVSGINVLSGSGFTIKGPKVGDQLPTNGSAPIIIDFSPAASGTVTGSIEIDISDMSGQSGVSDTIHFTANVSAPVRSFTLSTLSSDSLLACRTRLDSVRIVNNGECDTMIITGATPSSAGVSVVNTTFPIRLNVGSSAMIYLQYNPNNVVADLNGTLKILSGPDTSIAYHVPVGTCGTVVPGVLSYTIPDSVFNTKNCVILQREYTLTVTKDQTTITSISIPGGSKFLPVTLENGASLPYVLKAGDVLKFLVAYNPDLTGSDNTTLTIVSSDKGSRTVALVGQATGAPSNAHIGIQTASGASSVTVAPSATATQDFAIVLRDPINPALGLATTHFVVKYDGNILTKMKVQAANGWTVLSDAGQNGLLDLKFSYSGAPLSAGAPIATITMLPSLAGNTSTGITVEQTHFNEDVPNYERCTLSATTAGDVVNVNVSVAACNDSILLRQLRGQPVVSDLRIQPNPVHIVGGESPAVSFSTAVDAVVVTDVVDLTGHSVATLASGMLAHGDHSFAVPTNKLAEGTYFVRVNVAGQQSVKKFILQKE